MHLPKLNVLYNPLLDDSEHSGKSAKIDLTSIHHADACAYT